MAWLLTELSVRCCGTRALGLHRASDAASGFKGLAAQCGFRASDPSRLKADAKPRTKSPNSNARVLIRSQAEFRV